MAGLWRHLVVLWAVLFGSVISASSQEGCSLLSTKDSKRSGIEQVCEKPANRKSWGALAADYIGYRGYQKSYALVVGISQYTEGYGNLPTGQDALRMRDFLFQEAGFDYVHVLTEGRVTISRIRELMIDEFRLRVDQNDRFLFYWSGHGDTTPDGTKGFLPVSDSPKGRYSKMIDMSDIQRWNGFLKAEQSLYLIDSCFSGLAGTVSKSSTRDLAIRQLARPSHHLLTAGTKEEEAIAGDRWGGSLFTSAVLEGLRGRADAATGFDRDGVVSLYELMTYVQLYVGSEKDRQGWNRSLTPQLRDLRTNSGQFFFLTNERKDEKLRERHLEPSGVYQYGEPVVGKSSRRAPVQLSPALIQEAQEVLTALGYQPGPVDGRAGIRTQGAIRAFQRDSGLTPSGQLDEATINQLASSWGSQPDMGRRKPPSTSSTSTLPQEISNSIGMEFILIPAGAFTMGSPDSDPNAYDDEKPAHQVTISEPFYMGKYEVTQAQWKAVMGTTIQEQRDKGNKDWSLMGVGAKHPIYYVSWNEVQDFIDKLNQKESKASGVLCRLPTEAQWEYAARAESQRAYSFGDDAAKLGAYAWYGDNAGGTTHPVGEKQPNKWGLYDMHGNVWEWVADGKRTYTSEALTDPTGPTDAGAGRVFRGGGWLNGAPVARSALRFADHPGVRNGLLGFRCLSSVPSK